MCGYMSNSFNINDIHVSVRQRRKQSYEDREDDEIR